MEEVFWQQGRVWMKRLAKKALNKLRRYLILRQVRRAALPSFAAAPIVRRRYTFAGKVQKVGFRFELAELAKRLGLVGWCCNLPGGEVLADCRERRRALIFWSASCIP